MKNNKVMRVKVFEIPEDGLTISARYGEDKWFSVLIDTELDLRGKGKGKVEATLSLQAYRTGKQIQMLGGVYLSYPTACDRCLKELTRKEQLTVEMLFLPHDEFAVGAKEGEVEDQNVTIYDGREIDLVPTLTEQVSLARPMHVLCNDDCKGLCQKCGEDLNAGKCKCKKDKKENPFTVLKKWKK